MKPFRERLLVVQFCLILPGIGTVIPVISGQPVMSSQAQVSQSLRSAFQMRAEGRYDEALHRFLALLAETVNQEGTPPEAQRGEAAFLLAVIEDLAGFMGAHAKTLAALDCLFPDLEGKAPPCVRDLLGLARLACLERLPGRMAEALALTRSLGYVGTWAVVGPFENERGGGFKQSFGPEKEFIPSKRYRGKVREVGWRAVDGTAAAGGYIDLDALLRPGDQVLAHAAFALILSRPETVALHLGSDEAVVVWVNGREVLRRDVRRPFRPDQDRVGLRLQAGSHRIGIKVCDQDGPWGFALRITRIDGGRLEGARFSAESRDIAGAGSAPRPELLPVPWDSRTYWRNLAEKGDPVAALKLAVLLLHQRPHDAKSRQAHAWARKAAEGLKGFAYAHYLAARALSRRYQHRAEMEENLRRESLERAVALDTRFAEAYLDLASYHKNETDNLTRAEALVEKALEINEACAPARVYRAWLLERRGWPLEYRLALEALVKSEAGKAYPDALVRLARIERARGCLGRTESLAARAQAQGRDSSALRLRIRALLGMGKAQEAEVLLRSALLGRPFSLNPRRRLADFLEAVGRLEETAGVVEAALRIAPEHTGLLLEAARLQGLLGHDNRMIAHMRRALELDPKLNRVERHLQFIEAGKKSFYAGLEVDASAAMKEDTGPPAEAVKMNASHYYLFRHRVVNVNPDGTRSEYGHFMARILTEAGGRRFARFSVPYSSYDQHGRILEARVIRTDGRREPGSIQYARVTFQALNIGDTVEVVWRRDDIRQSFFGDYFGMIHLFQAADLAAVGDSRLDLILPEKRSFFFQVKNGRPDHEEKKRPDGRILHRYRMRSLKGLRLEARQPDAEEFAPLVGVTTYEDWDAFASWWWNLTREQVRADDAIRAKVKDLIRNRKTRAEKIRALYEFVVTDINYTAWEFGVHGYKPYEASAIFARRFGDCKDKAILLCTMLAEIGVEAYPVIIHADTPRSRDDLTLPMVEHFNHCIAYLPGEKNATGMFMDGTASFHPLGVLPDMDRGARVLVVEDGKAVLRDVPWGTPEANGSRTEYDVFLKPGGSAEIRITLKPVGGAAVAFRDRFASQKGLRRKRLEDRFAPLFGKVALKDMRFSDLDDLAVPVKIQVTLEVDSFLRAEDGRNFLKYAFRRHGLSGLVMARARRFDLLLGPPRMESTRIRYRFPPGIRVGALPADRDFEGPHGTFSVRTTRTEDGVAIERKVRMTATRVPGDAYAMFQKFVQALDDSEAQTLEVFLAPGKEVGR